jgi:hypothetical protein
MEFGTFLPRDTISAELAQTCDELRRFLDERNAGQEVAATTTSSSS